MDYYRKTSDAAIHEFDSDMKSGLTEKQVEINRLKYGKNSITGKKKKSIFAKIADAVKEPMLIILLFGFFIALGANIGKELKSGDGDFVECFGILFAVILSVGITLFMEGSSERAFESLNKIYDETAVKVIRGGEIKLIERKNVVKGDVIILDVGDKVVADGRLISSQGLAVDESALTGESRKVKKDASWSTEVNAPLSERNNCVYSGTFIVEGSGKMVVTEIGDGTEIGRIAGELSERNETASPLSQKLNKLGKGVTLIGVFCAILVFIVSALRLYFSGNISAENVSDLFISCIVLIVAAVPEGLPTIVAVSLALNMIKLAKEKALIKKMVATETAGAVSVICSDKTGTLTQNKMSVVAVCNNDFCLQPEIAVKNAVLENFVLNSTAEALKNGEYKGGGTECALLAAAVKGQKNLNVNEYRKGKPIRYRLPFTSDNKFMITAVDHGDKIRVYIKGAPEKVLSLCNVTEGQRRKLFGDISKEEEKARRILCFAHYDCEVLGEEETVANNYVYDGYAALADPVRKDVYDAIKSCKKAGINVKMLTGDNIVTAYAVAKELKIAENRSQAVNAQDLENLDEESLIKALKRVTVIARSTPMIKLKIVKALKKSGEVVAVTGDGINDAPAIKHADVGFAMGKSGSEITKEAADVVLLDDGFGSVVKAVSFGRGVYRNIQAFILFQLSVNASALMFTVVAAILGMPTPFNTLQLLWINLIMDGPPALTLGLEPISDSLMERKPRPRNESIVGKKTFLRILFNGAFISAVLIYQYLYNFLGATPEEKVSAYFTLFIVFQLFNALNCRKLNAESTFKNFGKNKVMLMTFLAVFAVHAFIVEVLYKPFGLSPMRFIIWVKCVLTAFSVIVISELYKFIYRSVKKGLWNDSGKNLFKEPIKE